MMKVVHYADAEEIELVKLTKKQQLHEEAVNHMLWLMAKDEAEAKEKFTEEREHLQKLKNKLKELETKY